MASVLIMARACKRMRMHVQAVDVVAHHIGFAASDMWDKLTPEQIRTLHPNTVDVGNGLPTWRAIREGIDHAKETETGDVHDVP